MVTNALGRRSRKNTAHPISYRAVMIRMFMISTIFVYAETQSFSVFRRTYADSSLESLSNHEGMRSAIECSSLCIPLECSGFNYSEDSGYCQLFQGDITTTDDSSDTVLLYKKVADPGPSPGPFPIPGQDSDNYCPTDQGFQVISHLNVDYCWYFSGVSMGRIKAKETCKRMESGLVFLNTLNDYDALYTAAGQDFSKVWWIDLTDIAEETVFVSDEGLTPLEGPLWLFSTPAYNAQKNCVAFHVHSRKLEDYNCGDVLPFVCEKLMF